MIQVGKHTTALHPNECGSCRSKTMLSELSINATGSNMTICVPLCQHCLLDLAVKSSAEAGTVLAEAQLLLQLEQDLMEDG